MRNKIPLLGALLIVQVALAVGLSLGGGDFGARAAGEPLFAFDPDAVQRIALRNGNGGTVQVVRGEDGWSLPEHYGFPAAEGNVRRLLGTLEGLAPALPVATSREAAERFRVAEDSFERRIDLFDGEGERLARLYVGDSPGARRAYVRAAGAAAVYEAEADRAALGAEPADWTDPMALRRKPEELKRIEAGDVTLVRDEEGEWRLQGLEDGQSTDPKATRELVGRLAFLQYDRVLGKVGDEPAGGRKVTTVTLTPKEGAPVEYRLRKDGNDGYTLTTSDLPWRFRVTKGQAEPLTGIDRATLVKGPEPAATR